MCRGGRGSGRLLCLLGRQPVSERGGFSSLDLGSEWRRGDEENGGGNMRRFTYKEGAREG